jgi:predicted small secreted protein
MSNHQDQKKKHPQSHHNQNTQHTEKRILRAAKGTRQATYKGKPIRVTADFLTQTLNIWRSWIDIIQALKESNCQPRLVYPAKFSFLIEGENKTFHNKEKLKDFATTKATLQKILKGLLYIGKETRMRQDNSRKNILFWASRPVNKE